MSRHLSLTIALSTALAAAAAAGCHGNNNDQNAAVPAASTAMPMTPPPPAATAPMMGSAPTAAGTSAMAGSMQPGSFVSKAATAGIEEVQLADLALSKSSNADVKAFAQKMKDDHSKANVKLSSIASADSIDVPTSLTAEQQSDVDGLKAKSGADFDKAYADFMVTDHQKAVALFESASSGASTPELRQFASDTLPTLRSHLQMAQTLQSGLSGGGGNGSAMDERFGAL
jgi:putative membrane protein